MLYRPLLVALTSLASAPALRAQCSLQELAPRDYGPGVVYGLLVTGDGERFVVGPLEGHVLHLYEQVGRTAFLAQEIVPHDGSGRFSMSSIDLDGDRLAIGARADHPDGNLLERVYVFEEIGGVWQETAEIYADGLAHADSFGHAVALEGNVLAVGAPYDYQSSPNTGAVYVYEKEEGVWSLVAEILPQGGASGERFGWSLDLEGDRIAIGAPRLLSDDVRAYVVERRAGAWRQSVLVPSNRELTGMFGQAIDLRGDRVLVGDSSSGDARTGAEQRAWLFEHDGTSWSESAQLLAAPGEYGAFGMDVALGADGMSALIGAPWDDEVVPYAGVVHVFEREGSAWSATSELRPQEPVPGGFFGGALALEGDLAVVVGAGRGTTYSVDESRCRTLMAQPASISLARGGRHTLRLNPGREHAGRVFLCAGSARGFEPGFTIAGARIPLVRDPYFTFVAARGFGVLGAGAPQAEVVIDVPAGTSQALAGLTLHHAFVVLDRGIVHVSNVRTLTLVP